MLKTFVLATLFAALPAGAQQAPQPAQGTIVTIEGEATREVANDELVALLAVEARGDDAAALAESVNARMAQALKLAAQLPQVRVQTGNYQTLPRYVSGRLQGWQIAQELKLQSRDFVAASRLIGRLQQALVLRSLSARLSEETRRRTENVLIAEAIEAFRTRAERVREALGSAGYRIRTLQVGSAGGRIEPAMRALAQAPALEPGLSEVTVRASGSIELR